MKRIILSALVLISSSAFAANNFYAGLDTGISNFEAKITDSDGSDSNDTTLHTIGATFGYRYNDNLRAELNIRTYLEKTIVDSEAVAGYAQSAIGVIAGNSVMLNGFYSFKNASKFTPYVGLGLGMSRIAYKMHDIELDIPDNTESVTATADIKGWEFAYSANAGVQVAVNDSTDLDFGIRFVNLGEVKKDLGDETMKVENESMDLTFGVNFRF